MPPETQQATDPTNAPEEVSEATAESSSEWEGFVEDFDQDDPVEYQTTEEAEAPTPETPTEPTAEKPEEDLPDDDGVQEVEQAPEPEPPPVAEPQAVVEEAQAPPQPVAPETQTQPQEAPTQARVEAPPQLTAEQMADMRKQALETISAGYALSEDELTDFETNPGKTLPRIAAEVQLKTYEQVVSSVMSQLPTLVSQMLESRTTSKKYEDDFFAAYEDLAPYKEQVTQVAAMWSNMNQGKQYTPEQRMAEIARFARAAIGVAPVQQSTRPSAPAASPPIPSAPPPQAGPVSPATTQRAPDNPWESFAQELLDDPDM